MEDSAMGTKGSRPLSDIKKTAIVVLVIAVIILAALSVVLFVQYLDYRGSKYRAQRVLMFDMSNVLTRTGMCMSQALDAGYDSDLRSYVAIEAAFNCDRLDWLSQTVASMYRGGDGVHSAFSDLGQAFDKLNIDMISAYEDILQSGHAIAPDLNATLTSAMEIVWDLATQFQDAVQKIDGFGTPSSPPVKTLDIGKVGDDATSLLAVV